MKLNKIFYIVLLFFFSCKLHKVLYKKSVDDAVIVLSFERAGNEGKYIFKSEKIVLGNQEYDLISWVPPQSELDLLLDRKGINAQIALHNKCFDFKEGDILVSDHIYCWLNDEDYLSVIYRIKGHISIINKLPLDRKYGKFNNYSCPVYIDTLNIPYCKIISIDSCYTTSLEWLNGNHYVKTGKNNFKVDFCD